MNRVLRCVIIMMLGAAFTVANADGITIGVVDFQKLSKESGKLDGVRKRLETKFSSRREKLVKLDEQLKKDIVEFKKDSAVMNAAKKKEAEKNLMASQANLEKESQAYQKELNAAHNQAMQDLSTELQAAVKKVAQKGKYDLIMQKDTVPYSNDKLDLTNKVLKTLH